MNPDAIAETLARIEDGQKQQLAEVRAGQAEFRAGLTELRAGQKQTLAKITQLIEDIAALPENDRALLAAVEKSRTTQ